MTFKEEQLNKFFKEEEGNCIHGTEYWGALIKFASDCFNMVKEKGDQLKICDIHDYISAAYRVGYKRAEEATTSFFKDNASG